MKRALPSAMKGEKGDRGDSVSLRATSTAIQWKIGEDDAWRELFDFSTIRGETGLTGQGISYKWTSTALTLGTIAAGGSDVIWGDSVELKGEKGDTGLTGQGVIHEWNGTRLRLGIIAAGESSTTWGEYVDLKGDQGEQGIQGIQGLQGEKGDKGDQGERGEKGDPFTYDDFTPEQIDEIKRPLNEAAESVVSMSKNLPKIVDRTWRVYNPSLGEYEDSGVDATGKPPIIQSGTWWLWNYATQSYVDSGQSINSSYKAYVPRKYASDVDLSSLSTYEDDGETKAFTTGNMIFVENELEPTGYSAYIYTPSGSGFAWVKLVLIMDGMNLVLVNK